MLELKRIELKLNNMYPLISDYHKRKQARKEYYLKYIYGWRQRPCTACNGSGYWDNTDSPACAGCNGSGKERYPGPKVRSKNNDKRR